MNGLRIIGISALTLSAMYSSGQTDSTLEFTLMEAQNFAIENFYLTRNAELDIEAAEQQIKETTAIGLPQISGAIDYTYIPEVPEIVFGGNNFLYSNLPANQTITSANINNPDQVGIGFEPFDPVPLAVEHDLKYNVMLNQLLFSGEYIVGLQASKTYKRLSQESFEKASVELKEMVAGTYFAILILEKNETLLTSTLENLSKVYGDTKKSADVGLIESTEADQIAINVKRTENSLNSVKRQIEFMYKMLKYQLGVSLETNVILEEDLTVLIERNLIDVTSFSEFMLEEHIDYKLLATQEQLSRLSMKQQKSRYLPTLSAFYKYEDKFERAALDFTFQHMVGVSMSVPIFESGSKNAKVSQARIELEKSQILKEQESQRLIMEAQQARYDYLNAMETYYNEQDNFDLSDKILMNTTARYNQGMVSSMDLTLANNQYLEAQLSLSTALLNLLNSKITLDKAFSRL